MHKWLVILSVLTIVSAGDQQTLTTKQYIKADNSIQNISMPSDVPSLLPYKLKPVRSELKTPDDSVLLQRPDLMYELEKHFSKNIQGVTTVAIIGVVGMGGVGKTTIARLWGRLWGQQHLDASIWEINAATITSINNSFQELAQELAQSPQQKAELAFINQIQNAEVRTKRRLTFVKEQLKERNDWLLIYDNVESYKEIKEYLPQDPEIWGNGHVIITTRNVYTAENFQQKNTITLGALNSHQAFALFTGIRFEHRLKTFSTKEKERNFGISRTYTAFSIRHITSRKIYF